jgi:hypothetical protein
MIKARRQWIARAIKTASKAFAMIGSFVVRKKRDDIIADRRALRRALGVSGWIIVEPVMGERIEFLFFPNA